jgi:hypothetical protein
MITFLAKKKKEKKEKESKIKTREYVLNLS